MSSYLAELAAGRNLKHKCIHKYNLKKRTPKILIEVQFIQVSAQQTSLSYAVMKVGCSTTILIMCQILFYAYVVRTDKAW